MNRKNKTVIAVAGFDPFLVETVFFPQHQRHHPLCRGSFFCFGLDVISKTTHQTVWCVCDFLRLVFPWWLSKSSYTYWENNREKSYLKLGQHEFVCGLKSCIRDCLLKELCFNVFFPHRGWTLKSGCWFFFAVSGTAAFAIRVQIAKVSSQFRNWQA